MADTKLTYLGAPEEPLARPPAQSPWRRLPVGFLTVVGLPTLIGALYFGVIASPRNLAESHFV